ncbi:MAG: anion permease [Candidatus Omnitrophica bacterium]|nr:anion permease [Candidatus Omnitrophota bacterium]
MQKLKIPFIFAAIVLGTSFFLAKVGFTRDQVISTAIFLLIICGTLFYWPFRVTFAFAGIATLLATRLLDVPHVIEHAGLDIILFLVGMMCVVGYLEEKRFFEYIIAKVVDQIGHRARLLMFVLMLFATLSAALVDEVTSILFMMATMFHLTNRYHVNPTPFLLMIVFATNIGSSATAVGNPIGVMIALRGSLSFSDFLRWASPISLVTIAITIPICLFYFKNEIHHLANQMKKETKEESEISHVHFRKKDILVCWVLFLGTIGLLVTHHAIEEALGLEKNTMLLGTALFAGSIAILLNASTARDFFTRRVDWWTLTFFMALFASVGTLKYTGVTERIAREMISIAGGNPTVLLVTFTGAISLLTGFMDNVLAVATFIPILSDIEKSGVFTYPFWWGMLFGGTLCGNLTVIGSTANIVAMGMLEKEYKQDISFMTWLKPGFIVSAITIVIALFLIYLQIPLMPNAPQSIH